MSHPQPEPQLLRAPTPAMGEPWPTWPAFSYPILPHTIIPPHLITLHHITITTSFAVLNIAIGGGDSTTYFRPRFVWSRVWQQLRQGRWQDTQIKTVLRASKLPIAMSSHTAICRSHTAAASWTLLLAILRAALLQVRKQLGCIDASVSALLLMPTVGTAGSWTQQLLGDVTVVPDTESSCVPSQAQ